MGELVGQQFKNLFSIEKQIYELDEIDDTEEDETDSDSDSDLTGTLSTDSPLYIYPDSSLEVEYPDFDIVLFP